MSGRGGRRSKAPRILRREPGGELVDERDGRTITLDELRDDLRAGRRFHARRAAGGTCTYAVLAELLTGREPEIGSPAGARPRSGGLLERALLGAFDWDEDDRGERPRAGRDDRSRGRGRARKPRRAPGPPR